MATSTNYGWAEPDNSSLVKNGAQDIRTLGNAIDASVWSVGFGQTGKNKVINGNFSVWQRGTSTTSASAATTYLADRFRSRFDYSSGTASLSQQAFTPGAAPAAPYEGSFFLRLTMPSGASSYGSLSTSIEDVRTLAGQQVTVSFWAKTSSAQNAGVLLRQDFGSGGSTAVDLSTTIALTTSWQRFTYTTTLGSMTGKTIGTGSHLLLQPFSYAIYTSSSTIDIWGVQVEQGAIASPFQPAGGGSQQAELAMCQRYYYRQGGSQAYQHLAFGSAQGTTASSIEIIFPVQMRTTPTSVDFSTVGLTDGVAAVAAVSALTLVSAESSPTWAHLNATSTGLTGYRFYNLLTNNSTSGYVGLSAEL
jgi:hypothetical protein